MEGCPNYSGFGYPVTVQSTKVVPPGKTGRLAVNHDSPRVRRRDIHEDEHRTPNEGYKTWYLFQHRDHQDRTGGVADYLLRNTPYE